MSFKFFGPLNTAINVSHSCVRVKNDQMISNDAIKVLKGGVITFHFKMSFSFEKSSQKFVTGCAIVSNFIHTSRHYLHVNPADNLPGNILHDN